MLLSIRLQHNQIEFESIPAVEMAYDKYQDGRHHLLISFQCECKKNFFLYSVQLSTKEEIHFKMLKTKTTFKKRFFSSYIFTCSYVHIHMYVRVQKYAFTYYVFLLFLYVLFSLILFSFSYVNEWRKLFADFPSHICRYYAMNVLTEVLRKHSGSKCMRLNHCTREFSQSDIPSHIQIIIILLKWKL